VSNDQRSLTNETRARVEMRVKQSLCSKRRAALLEHQTIGELRVAVLLGSLGERFIAQKGFIAGDDFCIADFYLPSPRRLVVEIDGPSHQAERQIVRDRFKDAYYRSRRCRVLRITEATARTITEDELAQQITVAAASPRNLHQA